jgi:hypothetical protein
MKRIIVIVVVMLASLVLPVGAALAQGEGPDPNAHNCGGTSSVGTIEALGSGQEFGQVVSGEAREQNADNVTQANCNETPRQNP